MKSSKAITKKSPTTIHNQPKDNQKSSAAKISSTIKNTKNKSK